MQEQYKKIYEDFLDKVTELHNAHVSFTTKPNNKSCRRLRKAIGELKEHMNPFRMEVFRLQREYSAIQQQKWLEHKEAIRLKKEAKDKRRKEKENKK